MAKTSAVLTTAWTDPLFRRKAWNLLGFQLGWFACVLGAAHGFAWVGPVVVGLLLALHLRLQEHPGAELRIVAAAALLGLLFDTSLAASGQVTYLGSLAGFVSPPWILSMWINFGLTLRSSMSWLEGRPGIAPLMGAVSGPFSYFAGARLGAVELAEPSWIPLALLAVGWAIALPLLFRFAHGEAQPC